MYEKKKVKATHCLECGDVIPYGGRADRKFCCPKCKSKYHNKVTNDGRGIKLKILNALAKNYSILEELISTGTESITLTDAETLGFKTAYATSFHKRERHLEYSCYDIKYCVSLTRIFKIHRMGYDVKKTEKAKWCPAKKRGRPFRKVVKQRRKSPSHQTAATSCPTVAAS